MINCRSIFVSFIKLAFILLFLFAMVVLLAFYYNDNKFYPILFIVLIFLAVWHFVPKILRSSFNRGSIEKFSNLYFSAKIGPDSYLTGMGNLHTKKDANGLYPFRKYKLTFNRFKDMKSKIYYIDQKTRNKIVFTNGFVFFGVLVSFFSGSFFLNYNLILPALFSLPVGLIIVFFVSFLLRNNLIEKNFIKTRGD